MIETFLGSLIAIICISIGYYLGKSNFKDTKETISKTRQLVEEVVNGKPDVGAVLRPTPHDLKRANDPKFAEEEDEMIKQFNDLNNRRVE